MKPILTLLTLALFALPLPLAAMSHGEHSDMEMNQGGSMKLGPAKLGPFKKTAYWSKRKHFKIQAPMVPVSKGMAEFTITVLGRDNSPAGEVKITQAEYYMPGMKMDLPQVTVEPTDQDGQFKLRFPVTMEGYWKLKMTLDLGGVTDQATIKFITK